MFKSLVQLSLVTGLMFLVMSVARADFASDIADPAVSLGQSVENAATNNESLASIVAAAKTAGVNMEDLAFFLLQNGFTQAQIQTAYNNANVPNAAVHVANAVTRYNATAAGGGGTGPGFSPGNGNNAGGGGSPSGSSS